ncbi:Zinc finger protein CONSTANS-LIKE 9 [Capsicum annuum]|uniref:Zinc finger protein CONSTANS-LIKE 9 n=1 Tax=Capsicum annuum TaxID=4072 RepID=A0A2G2Z1X8_CAPAN|nr:zinc finger protein CONSTANS-LIKE 9 [Capsicum annuum]XP_016580426.2 zinc finger protein CONSTANS-LIKE 9 [Capsicum annuum]XP_016580427.2 zinc finger protein CONSTANS-LIKE 9 [Capsicum annuum]XP_016580428.2 zinc finger protein CONSTANS-LIKE 9 [Capsicum annuum]KAF3623924.1 Zinc finger protein CONSTANS-LIKE 9 [Capsicum annuum]PHT75996.1 Zinc finger protein CONSTANS-LIKE 9 [Capsicum annuum]
MGYTCEFCGEQRSIVYCRSDAACLCLSCDRNVHSANALSQRHSRTLVCERCNSQPAIFRCVEERVSLCQNCDWMAHASSSTGSTHRRQALSCYTGCPSAAELSTIWSFLLEDPSVGDSTCEQGMGSMSITDCRPGDSKHSQVKDKSQDMSSALDEVNDLHNLVKSAPLVGSSMPNLDNDLPNVEPPVGSTNLTWSKVSNSGTKGSNLFDDDPFHDDFNMDEVDLSIENYEELFGVSLDNRDHLFKNEDIDDLFGTKDMSVAESSFQGVNAVEGSAVGRVNAVQPACSNAASAESMMSCKTEPPTLCFARKQSSFSFSNLTGESSAGDYQDSGASSMVRIGEPPWCPPCPVSSMPSTRSDAVLRYIAKKKTRQFDKRVRYVSRKARADVRRRVKGRFVKAGDAYDYDPLSQSRSY